MRHDVFMEPRLVELSRTLDAALLGKRIRNARLAAGLTQAQATDGEVSATYLSRIEDGQRRASVGLLERMAARMGVDVESLLAPPDDDTFAELRLALDHAELKFKAGDAAGALAACEAALASIKERQVSELLTDATYLRARMLEAVGDYNAAILVFEDLTATPSASMTWLKAAQALTRCYRETGDTAAAIEAGERACAQVVDLGLDGTTEAIQLTVTTAAAYDVAGDNDRALRLCLRALETAEKHGASPVAHASAYWNASIAQQNRGDLASATEYAHKALTIFEAADDLHFLAALRVDAAELHLALDPPGIDEALELLASAESEMGWSGTNDAQKTHLLVAKARAHLMAGGLDAALASLDRAALIAPGATRFTLADAASIAGQIAAASGRFDEARARYLDGVHLLSEVKADRKVSNLWYELAELLDEAGDADAAREAYRAAAAASGAASRRRVTQPR